MRLFLAAACLSVVFTQAHADDATASDQISIELNAVSQVDSGCQLTFLTSSDFEQEIEKVVFETVLIDADGAVTLLTLFDFGSLPPARPRVRQFVIPQQDCSALGRILINGVTTCSAPDLDESACEAGLIVTSRTSVELIG